MFFFRIALINDHIASRWLQLHLFRVDISEKGETNAGDITIAYYCTVTYQQYPSMAPSGRVPGTHTVLFYEHEQNPTLITVF